MSFRSLPVDSMQDKCAPFTKNKKGEDNELEEDEEGNEGEEFEDMWAFERTSRVTLSIPIMKKLLGQFFELPMKVTVNAPGEGMRQFAWLRVASSTQVAMHVQEPLLSKLKGCRSKFRKWSQSDEMSSDGTPCLTLELGVLEGTSSQYRGVTRNGNNMAAKISSNGPICLGTYSTEEEAARIVDSASHYYVCLFPSISTTKIRPNLIVFFEPRVFPRASIFLSLFNFECFKFSNLHTGCASRFMASVQSHLQLLDLINLH